MIRPVAITPGAMQFAVIPKGPRPCAKIPRVMSDSGVSGPLIGVAAASRWCRASYRANRDDLPRTLSLYDRGDRVARIDGPEVVHRRDKLQERRVKGAGFGIHGPTTTAARIRDQDMDPTTLLDDARRHGLD